MKSSKTKNQARGHKPSQHIQRIRIVIGIIMIITGILWFHPNLSPKTLKLQDDALSSQVAPTQVVTKIPPKEAEKPLPKVPAPAPPGLEPVNLLQAEVLEETKTFQKSVLHEKAAIDQFRRRLSDPQSIRSMTSLLKARQTQDFQVADQRTRMGAIDFLRHALSWKDNPARQTVIEEIEGVILSSYPHQKQASRNLKKDLVGDQIELYIELFRYAKTDAIALLKSSGQEGQGNVIRYAHKMAESLLQRP